MMKDYLASTEYIDWKEPSVQAKAEALSQGLQAQESIAKVCFEYVRDEIKHSNDYQLNPVTCKASDALKYKTGYCYAKSHLLAALLRANGIPAGLSYQRLTIDNDQPPFCLHSLNAVYLPEVGWYRIDARGNKEGVDAQFTPPTEKLAYPIMVKGEADLPGIYAEPLEEVVSVLTQSSSYDEVANKLSDMDINKNP